MEGTSEPIYEEELTTWEADKQISFELTDTKCFKTPTGVQKTATIGISQKAENPEAMPDNVLAEETYDNEHDSQPSTSSELRPSVPLNRMQIKIGKKILRFKVIDANDAPEGPDNLEPSWWSNPTPVTEPKALAGLFHCPNCKTYFGNKEVWQRHMTDIHGDPRPYRCFSCGMRFANKTSMTMHLKEHSLLRPFYACEYCPMIFTKDENRKMHQKMHVVRYTCQHCARFFRTPELLEQHIHTYHTNAIYPDDTLPNGLSARFRCTYCPKKFHFKKDMVIHERVHTGEKPFTCGYCGKGFSQSQTLTIHIRTHTHEFPYKCGTCNRKFRDSSALRKHELTIHTEEPVSRPLYRVRMDRR